MEQVIHLFGAPDGVFLGRRRTIKHFVCQRTSDLPNLLDEA